mgnify:CR=1 FL=1
MLRLEISVNGAEIMGPSNHLVIVTSVIFLHAVYLFLLILIRELVKDLENIKGDLTLNYKTIPIVYGVTHSKLLISFLVFFTGVTIYFILKYHDLGYMLYYFYLSFFLLSIFILLLCLNRRSLCLFYIF